MKLNREMLVTISGALIITIASLFFVRELKVQKENQVRAVILNLEGELVCDFSAFEEMEEEYIINGKEVDMNLYKEKIDNSFKKIEEYKSMVWKKDMSCDRNSTSIDKRLVFLNNTYNMLKNSEDAVITSYSSGNYERFEDILKCVNGHLKESFYDTKNHDF